MGVSRLVVQAILDHKGRSVTAVYDRHGRDPGNREALSAWGRRVEQSVRGGAAMELPVVRAPRLVLSTVEFAS
jgi:hypothetical protein